MGEALGVPVGVALGDAVGVDEGVLLGVPDGAALGETLGVPDGAALGDSVGHCGTYKRKRWLEKYYIVRALRWNVYVRTYCSTKAECQSVFDELVGDAQVDFLVHSYKAHLDTCGVHA